MGRRNDLAGLAALGALGMILNDRNKAQTTERYTPSGGAYGEGVAPAGDDMSLRGGAEDERPAPTGMGEATRLMPNKTPSRKPNPVSAKKALDQMSGGSRRGPAFETGSGGGRGPAIGEEAAYLASKRGVTGSPGVSYDAPMPSRRLSPQEALAQIPDGTPMDPNSDRGPNAVDSTELGRNFSALTNGLGPGKLVTGLSLAAREARAASLAQKAYNARAAARRTNEGLNATEAAAARDRLREASFEGGMKKGGSVKKSFSNKPTKISASSRGDGIAMRGKTRGIMR